MAYINIALMEKSMMYNPSNHSEAIPPMEPLPLKPTPPLYTTQPPSSSPPAAEIAAQPQQQVPSEVRGNSPAIGVEEADTYIFAIKKLNDFLFWFMTVLEVTLIIEFFLMLIGAAQNNLFAGFMYALTVIPLLPFNEIVPNTKLGTGTAVIDWSILIAMAVYFLAIYALRSFLRILVTNPGDQGE
jgi:uncharacterized protein YggT (Ycf19 family)